MEPSGQKQTQENRGDMEMGTEETANRIACTAAGTQDLGSNF